MFAFRHVKLRTAVLIKAKLIIKYFIFSIAYHITRNIQKKAHLSKNSNYIMLVHETGDL